MLLSNSSHHPLVLSEIAEIFWLSYRRDLSFTFIRYNSRMKSKTDVLIRCRELRSKTLWPIIVSRSIYFFLSLVFWSGFWFPDDIFFFFVLLWPNRGHPESHIAMEPNLICYTFFVTGFINTTYTCCTYSSNFFGYAWKEYMAMALSFCLTN